MSRQPPPSTAQTTSHRAFDTLCTLALPVLRLTGRPRTTPAAKPPSRILILKPDHLGDLILATPALQALHDHVPDALITVVTKSWTGPILRHHPAVHEVIHLDLPWCAHSFETGLTWRRTVDAADELARMNFDVTISLQDHAFTHLFSLLTCAPRRIGFAPRGGAPLLTDALPPPSEEEHAAASHQRCMSRLGCTSDKLPQRIVLTDDELSAAREYVNSTIGLAEAFTLFHIGAASAAKSLPISEVARIYTHLATRAEAPILVVVGPREEGRMVALNAELGRDVPYLLVDDVRRLAGIAAIARRVIAHDSGPAHVAAAVGTPVTVIFIGGNPKRWAPRGNHVTVIEYGMDHDDSWFDELIKVTH